MSEGETTAEIQARREEEEIHAEFIERVRRGGVVAVAEDVGEYPALPDHDYRAASSPEEYGRPRALPTQPFQRPPSFERVAERVVQEVPGRPKYKEIVKRPAFDNIEIVDEESGQRDLLTIRAVPSTQIPFLDRLGVKLDRVRDLMADLDVRSTKDERELERLAGQYNALMEEILRYSVVMPDGYYPTLDTYTLGEIQAEVSEMVRRARPQNDRDDRGGRGGSGGGRRGNR